MEGTERPSRLIETRRTNDSDEGPKRGDRKTQTRDRMERTERPHGFRSLDSVPNASSAATMAFGACKVLEYSACCKTLALVNWPEASGNSK